MSQASPNGARPTIYEYADYRVYLESYYHWEKSRGVFSHAIFAHRAGLKSRSYLRLVMTGKRNLTPELISKFIVGLGLDHEEGQAFSALVHYNQARDFESRKHYWESFLRLRPKRLHTSTVRDEYLFLARFAYPILLVILRQPHVAKDLEVLCEMSGLKLSELREALETLTQLGAITPIGSVEGNPEYAVNSDGFRTSNDVPNIAIQSFHRNMLRKAQDALDLDVSKREFQSYLFPLNEEEFLYLRRRIRGLLGELDEKFGGRRPQSKRVYAFNINLFPVTPDFIREGADRSLVSQKPRELQATTTEVFV